MMQRTRANLLIKRYAAVGAVAALFVVADVLHGQSALDVPPDSQRATVYDDQLDLMIVEIISLDESALHYRTRHGRHRQIPRAQVLAIIPQPAINPSVRQSANMPLDHGFLMLADGRRLTGALSLTAPQGNESIAWEHEIFGTRQFSFEEVSWFVQPSAAPDLKWDRTNPPAADEIILFNGDRLTGFVTEISPAVSIEVGGSAVDVEAQRLAAARLANPARKSEGMRVWLRDGSVVQLDSLEIDETGSVLMRLEHGPAHTEQLAPVLAVVFEASRIVPLSSLDPISQRPSPGRRFASPSQRVTSRGGRAAIPAEALTVHDSPPLDAFDILLPGPLVLEYELPRGTQRLSATATLDVGTSPWGDCEFIVNVDGVEVLRLHLSSESASIPFLVDTPGRSLTIEIDPGRYGPINDRVLIRRPLLLVDPVRHP